MNFRRLLPFYMAETAGIRITVRPVYLADQSHPARQEYVFTYFVRIENLGRRSLQLLSRHWTIHDSIGEEYEVSGLGVVGQQPVIPPGGMHEYHSFCVLKSPSGYMEGSYRFAGPDDLLHDATIPRFFLVADDSAPLLA